MTSRPRWRAVLSAGAVCALAVTGIAACSRGPARLFGAAPNTVTGTKPPPLTVLTRDTRAGRRDIFIAPAGGGYPAGPEILSTTGKVVWFHRLPAGDVATDFRTQTYLGRPVLTWFQSGGQGAHGGPGGAAGPAGPSGPSGTDYIYNDHYRQIATVRAGHGDATNFHEFLVTPWNTALILASTVTTANLTAIGGPANQQVIDGLVQEIDIKTGRVLFQWDSAGHVPYADSYAPLPSSPSTPWDWFHINAVHLDADGNLLVDSRNTWTMFKVNRHTGQITPGWPPWSSRLTSRRARSRRSWAARRPRRAAACSSAGARCPTSPSSARPASCCSMPSCRPGSARTAPTCCPGTRVADWADAQGQRRSTNGRSNGRRYWSGWYGVNAAAAASTCPLTE